MVGRKFTHTGAGEDGIGRIKFLLSGRRICSALHGEASVGKGWVAGNNFSGFTQWVEVRGVTHGGVSKG